jgi:hypothetical protein
MKKCILFMNVIICYTHSSESPTSPRNKPYIPHSSKEYVRAVETPPNTPPGDEVLRLPTSRAAILPTGSQKPPSEKKLK